MIKAVIIDDHHHAVASLKAEIAATCVDVQVMATASSVSEGVEMIRALLPDLIFLDIEMSGMDGFDLMTHFPDPTFQVVFVTAHTDFAIKAFSVNALDYLLKPVDRCELARAINKFRKLKEQQQGSPNTKAGKQPSPAKLAIYYNGSIIFLNTFEILFCQAEGSYTKVVTISKSYLISKNLKEVESYLPPTLFYRTHMSFLINLEHVVQYTRGEGGDITLSNGVSIPVAKSRKEELMVVLGIK